MSNDKKPTNMGRPGMHALGKKEKPRDIKKTLKRIFSYTNEYKFRLTVIFFAVIVYASAGVAGTYMLKPLINNYIVPFIGKSDTDLSGFITMLLLMAAVYLLGVIAILTATRLMVGVSTGTLLKIRLDLFAAMEKLPLKYHDNHTQGELMSRFTNDVDALRDMISQGIIQLINAGLTVISIFIVMLVLSPVLTALMLVMLLIMIQIIKFIGKRSRNYFVKQQNALGKLNGYIEEIIEGQKVVKVFCYEQNSKESFNERNEVLRKSAAGAYTFANILMPIMGNLSYINFAITAAIGGMLVVFGRLDIGTIGAYLQYTRSFSQPLTQASGIFNAVLSALAGAERIFAVIDEEPETDDGDITLVNAEFDEAGQITESSCRTGLWAWKQIKENNEAFLTPLRGDVRFIDAYFSYDGEHNVLKNIDLYAKPGQKIALVGSTGAGKTTITNLLTRFYDLDQGKILYDGINIKRIKKDDLRHSLAMVLQDTHLFTGTVMENIRYGRLSAGDDEVITAARRANADFFISHLPQGYQSVITADGANLSQGQRQLLAIARAAVADPPVLILDEATSSIDTRTEALIEQGMNDLMLGRTVFVIAHRLSTVKNAAAIIVLENGQIIERGSHNELLALQARYYQLYTGMFELT